MLCMGIQMTRITCPLVGMKTEAAHSFQVRQFCIIGPSILAWSSASRHSGRTLNERIAKDSKNRQEVALACLGLRERQVLSTIIRTVAQQAADLDE